MDYNALLLNWNLFILLTGTMSRESSAMWKVDKSQNLKSQWQSLLHYEWFLFFLMQAGIKLK